MILYNILSYPFEYQVSSFNLGIYRFVVFFFFLSWMLLNIKDIFAISKPKKGLNNCSGFEFHKNIFNLYCSLPRRHTLLIFLTMLFCFLSMLGVLTNVSITCFLFLFISLQNRIAEFISTTGDTIARSIIFFMITSPCGASFSIDSIFMYGQLVKNTSVPGFSILCIQWMIILMYLFAGICKLNDKSWVNGMIMLISTRSPIWGKRLRSTEIFETSHIARILFSRIVVYYQLASIFFLSAPETKKIYAILGILMHLSMTLTMNLGYFGQVMGLALLSFMI